MSKCAKCETTGVVGLVCDKCRINELEGQLENLQDDNVEKEARIKEMEGEVDSYRNSYAALRVEIKAMMPDVKRLKTGSLDFIRKKLIPWMQSVLGDTKDMANERYIELQAELAKHQWISVEDRLPEQVGRYLIVNAINSYRLLKISTYHPSRKQFNTRLVSHWKPITLPQSDNEPEKEVTK